MKLKNCIIILLLLLIWNDETQAQTDQYDQTIRGKVTDHETKQAIIGANIVILQSEPFALSVSKLDHFSR